jgi:multisubunit Na+/H+ antiporter MnhE subunit
MWASLATTITSGVLALGFLTSTTVLLATGHEVPSEFVPTCITLAGVAAGAAKAAAASEFNASGWP